MVTHACITCLQNIVILDDVYMIYQSCDSDRARNERDEKSNVSKTEIREFRERKQIPKIFSSFFFLYVIADMS